MSAFLVSYYVLLIALFLLGVVFLFIPVRKDERLRRYRVSLRLIALSYIALGCYCIFKGRYPQQLVSFPFLGMANLQAVLLGLSHLNLVMPDRGGVEVRRTLTAALVPPLCWALLYAAVRFFSPHVQLSSYAMLAGNWMRPEVLVRWLWLLSYIGQIAWFAVLFFRAEKPLHLKLVRWSFILALAVGVTTICITLNLSPRAAAVLNYAILVLYLAMGILYIQYPAIFFKVSTLLFNEDSLSDPERWEKLREEILDRALYLRTGITQEEMAGELGVSRNRLSALVNACEKTNFSTFIGRLRIAEAQQIMQENNSLPLSEVAWASGFSDASNFSRQFKKITGESPAEYRKKLQRRAK